MRESRKYYRSTVAKGVFSFCLVALLAVTLSGCRRNVAVIDFERGERAVIAVAGAKKIIYLPVKLAEIQGYFKDEGIAVDVLDEQSGVSSQTALLANQVQGAVGFYDRNIAAQLKGRCVKSVVQFANIPGEAEVVSVRDNVNIESPADFAGKSLGVTSVGSSTDFLTQALAGQEGIQRQDYTTVKSGAGPSFIASLRNGGIDAGMTTDPTITQVIKQGYGTILTEMRTVEGTQEALGGLYPASSLSMTCDFIDKNPQLIQKITNALVRALEFINDHSAEEITEVMPPEFALPDKELYIEALESSKGIFNRDGRMDPQGAQNVARILTSYSADADVRGQLDKVDILETYSTEFVDSVSSVQK